VQIKLSGNISVDFDAADKGHINVLCPLRSRKNRITIIVHTHTHTHKHTHKHTRGMFEKFVDWW